jgi:hypothetical protein
MTHCQGTAIMATTLMAFTTYFALQAYIWATTEPVIYSPRMGFVYDDGED